MSVATKQIFKTARLSLLVVEDDPPYIELIKRTFSPEEYDLCFALNGQEGIRALNTFIPDVILVDFKMPKLDGVQFSRAVRGFDSKVPIIIVSAYLDEKLNNVFEEEPYVMLIEKATSMSALKDLVKQVAAQYATKRQEIVSTSIQDTSKHHNLIAKSKEMSHVLFLAEKVASTDATVILLGETGVGKEEVANFIHKESSRSHLPFIRINCAALPENLMESELFGYEKGAFTGAETSKKGKFDLAGEGTLFFDEIGELPLTSQSKLLRVLQEREFVRVGGHEVVEVKSRFIFATNRVEKELKQGVGFRPDLWHRISEFPIFIPSLGERRDDIVPISNLFITYFKEKYNNKTIKGFSKGALRYLQLYSWPGNVRELKQMISKAVILCEDEFIEEWMLSCYPDSTENFIESALKNDLTEEELLKEYAKRVFIKNKGSKKKTAEALKVNYRTLVKRLALDV